MRGGLTGGMARSMFETEYSITMDVDDLSHELRRLDRMA
jgi:hypothetical protein